MSLWIKSHQTLRDHPKTRKAARLLVVVGERTTTVIPNAHLFEREGLA